MTFDLPPVRLVADFKASAMGIKPKSPGSVATVSQLKNVFGKQGLVPLYDLARVHKLIKHLRPTGRLLLLRVRNAEGRSIATGIYPAMNRLSHVWGNASYQKDQGVRPNESLHWYAMRYWKSRGLRWHDWGGGGEYKKRLRWCQFLFRRKMNRHRPRPMVYSK